MHLNTFENSPFKIQISFHKLIDNLRELIDLDSADYRKQYYEDLLHRIRKYPEISEGMERKSQMEKHEELIKELLSILFPSALTHNEIKAISMPFQNLIFNHSERFKKVLNEAGDEYHIAIRDFDQHQYYIMSCCIIMNYYFKKEFDITRPFFVDIPDQRGFMRHYKILYNADFVEILPTDKAIMLSEKDIQLLEDNYDDLEFWMSKFPQESWTLNGFGLVSLIDVTTESALSSLKGSLLKSELETHYLADSLGQIFSSIFKVSDLRIGFTPFEIDEVTQLEFREFMGFKSYALNPEYTNVMLCKNAYQTIFEHLNYFSISDVSDCEIGGEEQQMCENLRRQEVRSCIFAPIVINGKIEGIFEIVSQQKRALHSVNAQKLDAVMPIITDTFERVQADLNNQVEAIIQREYTTIHPSVYWKFVQEARRNYFESISEKDYLLKEIVFDDVYPLYGGVDIKGSTFLRNKAVIKDLETQLKLLLVLLQKGEGAKQEIIFEKRILKLKSFQRQVQEHFYTGLEQKIQEYIRAEVHPFLGKSESVFDEVLLHEYVENIEPKFQIYYDQRKQFDQAIGRSNKIFTDILDRRQREAQRIYPHYYERFKTDGVEHNIYIGASITPQLLFDDIYLQNLRLWQLQVFSEIIFAHYNNLEREALKMELTALILVYDTSLSIRFRMDEKRFDVDGAYHTRYEVIKKRLDKACVKDTNTRIVQPKKIAIVFTNIADQTEYLSYITFFQNIGLLLPVLEHFEVEDLQSVSGLTGIRVAVNFDFDFSGVNYDTLMSQYLKNQYL